MTAETLSARMAKADAEVGSAELELRQAALAAGIAPDGDEQPGHRAEEAGEKLRRARERRDLLSLAMEENERIEDQRKRQREAETRRSQDRAARAQIGLLVSHCADYEEALIGQVRASTRISATAEKIRRLLPSGAIALDLLLAPARLDQECVDELNRVSAVENGGGQLGRRAPGAKWPIGFEPWKMEPLSVRLKTKLLSQFDFFTGAAQPKPVVETPPIAEAVEIDPAPIASPVEEPEPVQEPVPATMPAKVQLDVVQISAHPIDAEQALAEQGDLTTLAVPPPPPSAASTLFGQAH